jgi:hypothetical protein
MGNLASDIDNPAFAGAMPDTSGLGVRFYKEARKNDFRSEAEGRPIFEDAIMIHIVLPGNNLFDVKEVVREDHKRRFPLQWAAFQNANGRDPMMIGTPLEQWPLLGLSQVEELKALKFYTVENIAQASDTTLVRMGMSGGMAGHALRDKAVRFLEAAKDDAAVNKQAHEIEKLRIEQAEKDRQHAEQMAGLQAQLAALTAAINTKPRGRPKKEVEA